MDEGTAAGVILAIHVAIGVILLAITILMACRGRKDIAIIVGSSFVIWLFTVYGGIVLLIVAIIFLIIGNKMVGLSIIGGIVIGAILYLIYSLVAAMLAVNVVPSLLIM